MTSRALILMIGILMASSAHAQNQCNYHKSSNDTCPDASDFIKRKLRVMKPYDPANFDPNQTAHYSPPMPDGDSTNPALAPYLTAFASAYDLAPQGVQAKLCHLKYIFVTTDITHTWEPLGIWEAPDRGVAGKNMYMAIPVSTLASATSLSSEENQLYGRLFKVPPLSAGGSLPYFTDSAPSAPAVAILAILAHELGHIMLADTNADGSWYVAHGKAGRRPCPSPGSCFDNNFLSASAWDATAFHKNNQRRWVLFPKYDPQTNSITNGNTYLSGSVNLTNVYQAIQEKNNAVATAGISNIYQDPAGLVSMLAAASPEEDFAETYKYKVLSMAQGGPLGLRINFPSGKPGSIDVVSRVGNAALAGKVSCLPFP